MHMHMHMHMPIFVHNAPSRAGMSSALKVAIDAGINGKRSGGGRGGEEGSGGKGDRGQKKVFSFFSYQADLPTTEDGTRGCDK